MELIKTNFIAITGGPGGGKSSLLNALNKKGFKNIDETGRAIIKERLSKGLPPRPAPEEFAEQMFQRDYKNYISNLSTNEILFFDRSFLDSAALVRETNLLHFEKIKNTIVTHKFNSNIFITPPWEEIYCNDSERDQTFEEAINTYKSLFKWHELNGYKPIILPKTSVEKRTEFVLNEIKNFGFTV
jgi:predicted ATPase